MGGGVDRDGGEEVGSEGRAEAVAVDAEMEGEDQRDGEGGEDDLDMKWRLDL